MSPSQPADRELEGRVHATLQTLNRAVARRVIIEVKDGLVTLRGDVPTFYARQIIIHECQRVPGVTRVNDELSVPV
jgi:osmotically-inducible protein OsmY